MAGKISEFLASLVSRNVAEDRGNVPDAPVPEPELAQEMTQPQEASPTTQDDQIVDNAAKMAVDSSMEASALTALQDKTNSQKNNMPKGTVPAKPSASGYVDEAIMTAPMVSQGNQEAQSPMAEPAPVVQAQASPTGKSEDRLVESRTDAEVAEGDDAELPNNDDAESSDNKIAEKRESIQEDAMASYWGDSGIRQAGIVAKPGPSRGISSHNRTYNAARDIHRDFVNRRLSSETSRTKAARESGYRGGLAFSGVIFSDPDLPVDAVSIGLDMVIDSMMDPESGIWYVISEAAHVGVMPSVEELIANPDKIMELVNEGNLYGTVEKSPVNQSQSVQRRRIKIHRGGGIGLHPTQGKVFNADFDSDKMVVNLDQDNVWKYRPAMTYLLDIEGNSAIDMDFFPIDPISPEQRNDEIESLRFWAFSKYRIFVDNDLLVMANEIFPAYYDLCNNGADKASRRFFSEIYRIAAKHADNVKGLYRDDLASAMLNALFDFSCLRRSISVKMQVDAIVSNNIFTDVDDEMPSDPIIVAVVDYVNSVVMGRPPYSLVEFGDFMNKAFVEIDPSGKLAKGRNIPFRMVADIAKAIHRTDLVTIGDPIFGLDFGGYKPEDPVPFNEVWALTCAAIETKRVANRIHFGSQETAASTKVRDNILRSVGFPDYSSCTSNEEYEEVFREWLARFIASYTQHQRLLNACNVKIRNGMTLDRNIKFDGIENVVEDVAKPIVEVYGAYSVERIFPVFWSDFDPVQARGYNKDEQVWIGYKGMTILEFSIKNRLRFQGEPVYDKSGKQVKDKNGNPKTKSKKQAIKDRVSAGKPRPFDILLLVADRRTKQFGDYEKAWKKATAGNVKLLSDMVEHMESKEFDKYMDEILEIFHMMSADMFTFFGIESTDTFARSKHGKRLIEASFAGNVDAVRSELVSMIVEWRLSKLSDIIGELESTTDEARSNALMKAREMEYERLGNVSSAWHTIIQDMQCGAGHSLFRALLDKEGNLSKLDPNKSLWELKAKKFWSDPGSKKYATILTFLKSEAPYETKMNVLCDLVRINELFVDLTPAHIIGMLSCDPDMVHGNTLFDVDLGLKQCLEHVKSSVEHISSFSNRSIEKMQKQNASFIAEAKKDKPAFEKWLGRLATEPGFAVYVPPEIAADAIASVFEKHMPSAEKIKNEPPVTGEHGCVAYQVNGGFFTHMQQADNKVVNVVGFDQITFLDFIKVLGDKNMKLYFYDRFGRMTKSPVTRASLCGGDSIDDVIAFLEDNPRLSACVRRYMVGVGNDVNGTAKMARFSYDSTESYFDTSADRVWNMLTDRPRFHALVAYVTPAYGDVGRNIGEKACLRLKMLCADIAEMALDERNGIMVDLESRVDKTFSLSEQKIFEALVPSAESTDEKYEAIPGLPLWERDLEELHAEAHAIYEMLHQEVLDVVALVGESSIELDEFDIQGAKYSLENYDYADEGYSDAMPAYSPDRISIKACIDVLQHVGGARTAKMLDVEGAETKRNMILKVWARKHPAIWAEAGTLDLTGEPRKLNEGEHYYDETVARNPEEQLKPIAKRLEVKREKAAETFNAKTKKFGDDGKNSIVKYKKYDEDSIAAGIDLRKVIDSINERILAAQDDAAREALRDEAVVALSLSLMKADRDLGYIDEGTVLTKSDYYNTAEAMLGQNSDGTLVIRTLEQLAAALNARVGDEVVFDMTQEEQDAVLEEIVKVIGTDMDPLALDDVEIVIDCLSGIPIRGETSTTLSIDRSLRQSSSSIERNYDLLGSIYNNLLSQGEVIPFKSRAVIEARSKAVWNSLPNGTRKKLYGIGFPKSWRDSKGRWHQGTDWSKSYDLCGCSLKRDGKGGMIPDMSAVDFMSPGPQTLVLFWRSPSENMPLYKKCKEYGATVAFLEVPTDNSGYKEDSIVANCIYTGGTNEGVYLLPIFDMKTNGFFDDPIMPHPSQYRANRSNFVGSVKDTTGEFGPADAGYTATKELLDRSNFSKNNDRPETLVVEDLFPNVIDKYGKSSMKVEVCSYAEVERYIVNLEENSAGRTAAVDYGVSKKRNPQEWAMAKKRYEMLVERYRSRFKNGDVDASNGFIVDNCRYNEIAGFVKITMTDGKGQHSCFAPIIPFPSKRSGKRPSIFSMIQPRINADTNAFMFDWQYSGDLYNQSIKFFEGYGSSNKFMVSRKLASSRSLESGWPIDGFFYHKAVESRLAQSNERIMTMVTMWYMAKFDYNFSYNFGMLPEAFPNNPDIKQGLAEGTLTAEDWKTFVQDARATGTEIVYYAGTDPDSRAINSLVKHFVEKCLSFDANLNPSILLSSRTTDSYLSPPWLTEFEVYMNGSYAFEDAFLKLFHRMQPTLCPDGIEGDSSACLFKPQLQNGQYDPYGTLLVLVSHTMPNDGSTFQALEAFFLSPSFFGEEYTDMTKIQSNAKNRFTDSLNVATKLSARDQSLLLEYGRSTASAIPTSAGYMSIDDDVFKQSEKEYSWSDFVEQEEAVEEKAQGE